MKCLSHLLLLGLIIFSNCSYSTSEPSLEYIGEQSQLSIGKTDSVEYYEQLESHWLFDMGQRSPFRAILYFDDQTYEKMLHEIRSNVNYSTYTDNKETFKAFSFYFKKHLNFTPECSTEDTMHRYINYDKAVDDIIVYCNRVYFKHSNKTALNEIPNRDEKK